MKYKEAQIFSLLRPHQWVKNFFIAAPMFFAFMITLHNVLLVVAGIAIFSLCASAVYVFNDIYDVAEDRQHPEKRKRPIASGQISIKFAWLLAFVLFSVSITLAHFFNINFFIILIVYVAINIFYTVVLKHIAIVDITIIAIGFVLRLFAGASIINVQTSMWIVLVTFWLALFLALAKRRDEYLHYINGKKVRKNIDGYNLEMINAGMVLLATITVVAYIMYSVTPAVMERMGSDKLYLTSIFVVVGILRYMQLTFVFEKSGNPTDLLLTDRFLQMVIALWLLSFYVIHVLA